MLVEDILRPTVQYNELGPPFLPSLIFSSMKRLGTVLHFSLPANPKAVLRSVRIYLDDLLHILFRLTRRQCNQGGPQPTPIPLLPFNANTVDLSECFTNVILKARIILDQTPINAYINNLLFLKL